MIEITKKRNDMMACFDSLKTNKLIGFTLLALYLFENPFIHLNTINEVD